MAQNNGHYNITNYILNNFNVQLEYTSDPLKMMY